MRRSVYLDNSSTTKPCELAVKYINDSLLKYWGNPSSLHLLGVEAEERINAARKAVADTLHCRSDEIYFTGSGTEANNTAIFGAARARKKRGKRIVTTEIEHSSVLEAMKALEEEGFEVIRLKPDIYGRISEEDIKSAVTADTVLVSIMLVNNETGTVEPVKAAADAIKAVGAPALLHCDAVQGFGKMKIEPYKSGIDLLTASGHKIHGPKGIGFLYIKKGVHIKPIIYGGGQEKGIRSGTECVPMISGLLGAVEALPNTEKQLNSMTQLWNYAKDKLCGTGFIKINSPDGCLPYILNISAEGYRSETLLHFLEAQEIYVSSGSACSKGEGSYVLRAMRLDRKRVDSALRLSFSRDTSFEDIDLLVDALTAATQKLRKA